MSETETTTTHYHTGHNIPGYLPESDVYVTADWLSARDSVIEDLDRAADHMAETWLPRDYDIALADLRALEPGSEFYVNVPSSDSEWDLGIAYWLEICLEDDCQPDREDDGR